MIDSIIAEFDKSAVAGGLSRLCCRTRRTVSSAKQDRLSLISAPLSMAGGGSRVRTNVEHSDHGDGLIWELSVCHSVGLLVVAWGVL